MDIIRYRLVITRNMRPVMQIGLNKIKKYTKIYPCPFRENFLKLSII